MSLITTAGIWNSEENNNENKKVTRRIPSKQTEKEDKIMYGPDNYPETNSNMNIILDKINNINVKNAGDNLMKFNPIKPPEINKKDIKNKDDNVQSQSTNKVYDTQNLGDSYSIYKKSYPSNIQNLNNTYNKINLEGFTNNNNNNINNLSEKINYMIHLLEEQKIYKTDHILEEFILYGFFGVFLIFVVDSFNKNMNKYTR